MSGERRGRRVYGLSPEPSGGAGQRIRDVSPLRLTLLRGDNTQYESFMRARGGGFLLITHTALLSFTYFALFSLLPGEECELHRSWRRELNKKIKIKSNSEAKHRQPSARRRVLMKGRFVTGGESRRRDKSTRRRNARPVARPRAKPTRRLAVVAASSKKPSAHSLARRPI